MIKIKLEPLKGYQTIELNWAGKSIELKLACTANKNLVLMLGGVTTILEPHIRDSYLDK